jgi:hypothetical protein
MTREILKSGPVDTNMFAIFYPYKHKNLLPVPSLRRSMNELPWGPTHGRKFRGNLLQK